MLVVSLTCTYDNFPLQGHWHALFRMESPEQSLLLGFLLCKFSWRSYFSSSCGSVKNQTVLVKQVLVKQVLVKHVLVKQVLVKQILVETWFQTEREVNSLCTRFITG